MDLRFGKIRNTWIVTGVCSAYLYRAYEGGIKGIAECLTGILAVAAGLCILYAAGGLGAGDIKLYMVTGGYLGMHPMPKIVAASLVLGAVAALIKLARDINGKLLCEVPIRQYLAEMKIRFTPCILGGVFLYLEGWI